MQQYDQIGNFKVGQLVQYWDDGLRAGHILAMTLDYASIKPIGAIGSKLVLRPQRVAWDHIYDVEEHTRQLEAATDSETSGIF